MKANKLFIFVVLAVSAMMISACNQTADTTSGTSLPNVPDITGNSISLDPVLATVNGDDIHRSEVKDLQKHYADQGNNVSFNDSLEQMIYKVLLYQEVKKANITITHDEAEAALKKQLNKDGISLAAHKVLLQQQNLSYEDEVESIKEQVATQVYLNYMLSLMNITVSDEEALKVYNDYKAQAPQVTSTFEELKPQIVATLQQQKQKEAINILMQVLRDNAEIAYK